MLECSVSTGGQSGSVTRGCDCLAHRFGNAADNGERRTTSAEAMAYWLMTLLMTRRPARSHPQPA